MTAAYGSAASCGSGATWTSWAPPGLRAGAVSFNLRGLSPYDVAKLLDQLGVAVRSGHHCAQPLLARFGLSGAVRVTPAFYNTREEIDALMAGLDRIAALSGKGR